MKPFARPTARRGKTLAAAAAAADRLVLDSLAEVLAGPRKARTKRPKKTDEEPSVPWLYAELVGDVPKEATDSTEPDAVVYAAAAAAFAAADPATTSPLAIVDEIESTFREVNDLPDEERKRLTRAFQAMRELIRNEREFEGFRPSNGDVALRPFWPVPSDQTRSASSAGT